MNTKTYEVTVTAKYPATGERPGVLVIDARNAVEAVKKARNEMASNGHTRQDGPLKYTAVLCGDGRYSFDNTYDNISENSKETD